MGFWSVDVINLSIALVSHNSYDDLKLLMPSLKEGLKNIQSEILLVDNNSEDDSVRFIKEHYPEVILTENKKKYGYGANQNKNLNRAKGRYVLFMNADMVIMPDTLSILCQFMEHHSDVGICSANVLNVDGTLQYLNKQYPSLLDLILRRFVPNCLENMFKTRLHYYEMRETGYAFPIDIPFISGCFMFCRTSIIRAVKGFDETYFLYFEDVDLCRKVQKYARTVSCPDAEVIHRWERAAHKELKWFIIFVKSAIQYFNKWGYAFY